MFIEEAGPTALRADLVRGLSLSLDVVELDGPDGPGHFCAALGAVWNGKRGYVAVLLRRVNGPLVRRFVCENGLESEADLESALDEGVHFVESMGFTMDHPEYQRLTGDQRRYRLDAWNDIRKSDRKPRHLAGKRSWPADEGESPQQIRLPKRERRPGPEPVSDRDGADPFAGWDIDGESVAPPGAEARFGGEEDRAVLGRLALQRRRKGELDPLVELLSYF